MCFFYGDFHKKPLKRAEGLSIGQVYKEEIARFHCVVSETEIVWL